MFAYEDSFYHDWSKCYGSWHAEYESGSNHWFTVTVKNIDESAGTITVDVTAETDDQFGIGGGGLTNSVTTTDIVAPIEYENTQSQFFEGAELSADIISYTYINEVGREVQIAFELSWGKDLGMYRIYTLDYFNIAYLTR